MGGSPLLDDGRGRIESDGAVLLPLDGRDCIVERIEPLLDDIERVRVDELRPPAVDGRRPVVYLQMNGAELVVRITSMPAH